VLANAAGMIAKYFDTIVRDAKCKLTRRAHQQLLADLDHFNEFGGVAVINPPCWRLHAPVGVPVVDGHRHIGLGQRRRIVRAVAGQATSRPPLIFADNLSFASGVACARKRSSTPASAADAAAVSGLSPVIITVLMPIFT